MLSNVIKRLTHRYTLIFLGIFILFYLSGQYIFTLGHSRMISDTVNEINSYQRAIHTFRKLYHYWPGDFPYARKEWPGAHNGDGNDIVDELNEEDLYAWEHLAHAGLIEGNYRVKSNRIGKQYVEGVNAPGSAVFPRSIYSFRHINEKNYGVSGHALILGALNKRGYPTLGAIPPSDTKEIDQKLDDGLAFSGNFHALPPAGKTGCVLIDTSGYHATYYRREEKTPECRVIYWIEKD